MAAPAGPAAKPSRLPCLMLWLVAGALLAGCAGTPPRPSRPPATAAVALAALSMLGTPYVSGGTSPRGFDCSGLVQYSYAQAGIHVPRTARGQFESSEPVPTSAMHAGDALFFRTGWLRRWHVGIYLGDGRFVHAPSRSGAVSIATLGDAYWNRHFVRAGRFAP